MASPKPMASPAISTPRTGMSRTIRGSTWGRTARASHWMPRPRNAATTPKTMAHRNIAPVGCPNAGNSGSPARTSRTPSASRGRRRRACRRPRPAARGPGRDPSIGPRCPQPPASGTRSAAVSRTARRWRRSCLPPRYRRCGGRGIARGKAHRQCSRPLPMGISGASGPSTTPKLRVPSAASRMPGSSIGGVTPAALNPSAGECPPVPGRRWIARATTRPATARRGSGHQLGGVSNPRSFGMLVKNAVWSSSTSLRKP